MIRVQGYVVEVFVYDIATAMAELDNPDDDQNPCVILLPHLPLFDKASYSPKLRRYSFNKLFAEHMREGADRSVAALLHEAATTSVSLINARTLSRVLSLERLANTGVRYFNYRNHRWTSRKPAHNFWDLRVHFPDVARVYQTLFSFDRICEDDVAAFILSVTDESARGLFRPRAIDLAVLVNDSNSYNAYRRSDLTSDMLRCAERCIKQIDVGLLYDRY